MTPDEPKRRPSPRNPQPGPDENPPEIQERDVAIFRALTRYRMMDSYTLFRLVYPEYAFLPDDKVSSLEVTFKKRLLRLTKWGYIRRILDDHLAPDDKPPLHEIYEIWDKGIYYLSDPYEKHSPRLLEEEITNFRVGNGLQLAHCLMIVNTLASIEIGVANTPGVRFISPAEVLAKAPDKTRTGNDPWKFPTVRIYDRKNPNSEMEHADIGLRADSPIFGFEYDTVDGKRYRYATIEVERTNRVSSHSLTQNSWRRKMLAYKEYKDRYLLLNRYNISNIQVYAIGPSQNHIESMKAETQRVFGKTGMFVFAAMRQMHALSKKQPPLLPKLFTDPLDTAGVGPCYMCTPDGKKPPEGSYISRSQMVDHHPLSL